MAPDDLNPARGPAGKANLPHGTAAPLLPVFLNATALSALIFLVIAGSDWLVLHKGVPEQTMLAADVIVAAIAGLLFVKAIIAERSRLAEERARREAMLQRLQLVAELNHHVRNALETIQWSAHTTHNEELIRNVQSSVDRIQWALRELLPAPDKKDFRKNP